MVSKFLILAVIDWGTAVPAVCGAIAGLCAFLQSLKNGKKVQITHDLINGRLSAMLAAAKQIGHAEGVVDGLTQAKEAEKENLLAVAKAAAIQVLAEAEAVRKKESDNV